MEYHGLKQKHEDMEKRRSSANDGKIYKNLNYPNQMGDIIQTL